MFVCEFCNLLKSFFYWCICHCTTLIVGFSFTIINPFFFDTEWIYSYTHICFISYYYKWYLLCIWGTIERRSPLIKFLVSPLLRYIIDHYTTISTSVKIDTKGLKPFLTGSVPELQLHNCLAVRKSNPFFYKIRSYCWLLSFRNLFVVVTVKKSGFANCRFTNQNDF